MNERPVTKANNKNGKNKLVVSLITYKTNNRIALSIKKQPNYSYGKAGNKTIELDEGVIDAMIDGLMLAREFLKGNIKKEDLQVEKQNG